MRVLLSWFLIGAFFILSGVPHVADAAKVQGKDWLEATDDASWAARRTSNTTVVHDGKLWVVGGYGVGGYLNDVWYSGDGVTWTEATANADWTARAGSVVLSFEDKLWVFSGVNGFGESFNDVWYSNDGATWTEATSSANWNTRDGAMAVVFDGKMWIMGGQTNGIGKLNDVWYSDDGITWTEATSSAEWSPRLAAQALTFDNKIWVIGGDDGSSVNDVWYSADGITWTEATSSAAWVARKDFATTVFNNRMWVIGGDDGSGTLNDVWRSSNGVTWTEATSSANWSARNYLSAQSFDDKMWVLGGQAGGSYFDDVWYSHNLWDLTFDSQGGSAVSSITDNLEGSSVTVPAGPTRSGYTFVEWNSASDGTGDSYPAGAAYEITSGNSILFAIWTEAAEEEEEESSGPSGGSYISTRANDLTNNNFSLIQTVINEILKRIEEMVRNDQPLSSEVQSFIDSLNTPGTVDDLDLEYGDTGENVVKLQDLLISQGHPIPAGATGSFLEQTRDALTAYQVDNNISPAIGYFGATTRAQMKTAGLDGIWW